MANKFQIKRTTVSGRTPNTTNSGNSSYIDAGELAINLTDRKLISSDGTVAFEIGSNLQSISVSSNATLANTTFTGTIIANGSVGSNNALLTSNTTGVYWSPLVGGVRVYDENGNLVTILASGVLASYIDNLLDVDTSTVAPTTNQTLLWNGTNWIPGNVAVTSITSASDIYFSNTSTNNMYIAANGNVGIGNTTPANKLVVAGTTRITTGDLRLTNGWLYFDANTIPTITKAAGNTTVAVRMDIPNLGGNSTIFTGAAWNGLHLTGPEGIANSTSGVTYPRTSLYYSYTSNTNPSDLYFNIVNMNNGGVGGVNNSIRIYAQSGVDGQTRGIDIAANGNVGINTTSPAEKFVVVGSMTVGNTVSSAGGYIIRAYSTSATNMINAYYANNDSNYSQLAIQKGRGTGNELQSGDGIARMLFLATNGSGSGSIASEIRVNAEAAQNTTSAPSYLTLWTTPTDAVAASERVRVTANGNVGIGNTAPAHTLAVGGPVYIGSYFTFGGATPAGFNNIAMSTSTTTANQAVVSVSSSLYRTCKITISVTSGSAYQAAEILLMHDGTNVYKTEYAQVYSGAVLATFDADINSGNMRLLTTPVNAVTTYRGSIQFISV